MATTDPRSLVFAFDQAVDRIGEEAGFLALGPHQQAARYLAEAHRMLDDVRAVMHRIDAGASDPMLRPGAQRRMHAIAQKLAERGLQDAEQAATTARRLTTRIVARDAPADGTARGLIAKGVVVGPLRDGAAKVTAWGIEKWTGSPVLASQLPSVAAATSATADAARVERRGRVPARPAAARVWRRTGIATAAVGGGGLALYGAWSLIAPLLGLG